MKRSAFVLLQRLDDSSILCVRNSKNKISFPGGKEELIDNDFLPVGTKPIAQFRNACREFQEEVNKPLPKLQYQHFEWGNPYHVIRIFYAQVEPMIADKLDGKIKDIGGDIVQSEWLTLEDLDKENVFYHIKKAINIWKIVN